MTEGVALLIRGGRVIDPANRYDATADVLIVDGVIHAVGRFDAPAEARIIDADGLVVAPGLVDMHVHLREPGYEYKETIAGGAQAAAAGGVTSMACMPNTRPVLDDIGVVRFVLDRANDALVNVFPIGAVTKGLRGKELTEMGLLQREGCVAFSDDGFPVMDSGVMRRALEYSRAFGALVIQHAEDTGLAGCGCMNEGLIATRLGLPGIPSESEEVMVDRDIRLARLTGGRYHVAHISTRGAVNAVEAAQKEGLPVTCEAAPHHFALTDEAIGDYDTNAKMAPPLRSSDDRAAVLEALSRGSVSVIATDHAPHDLDSKRVEFCKAANGVVGLETMLPVSLELVRDGVLDLSACLATMTCNPSRLLGIDRGTLSEGRPADVVLFDPDESWTVRAERLHGSARNTCFHGRRVKGRVKMSIVAGRVVFEDRPDVSF
ncbi:MAG: dihydroorotase [Magnetococcales bacterium]|nr:dihydroorotase [Magnetococcales bacterium]